LKTVKTEDLDLDLDNASHPTKREHAIPGAIKRDTAANIAGGKQVCVDGNVYVVVVVNVVVVVVNVLVIAYAVPGAIKRDTAANIAGGKEVCVDDVDSAFGVIVVLIVVYAIPGAIKGDTAANFDGGKQSICCYCYYCC
jgi:hypothetical protein